MRMRVLTPMGLVRRRWILAGWVMVLLISQPRLWRGQVFAGAAEQKPAHIPASSALLVTKAALLPASSGVVCLSCPAPEYPIEAAQRGIRGVVDLELTVSEDGRVEEVKVLAAPCDELEAASVKAAQGWTFRPAMRDGKPVREVVQVPVVFRLFQSHARLRQLPASTPASSASKAR